MGAAGAVIAGILLFKEPAEIARLSFLAMIIVGIVGLKFTHKEPALAPEKSLIVVEGPTGTHIN